MLPSAPEHGVGALEEVVSRLNTQPASTSVNASPTTSRPPAH